MKGKLIFLTVLFLAFVGFVIVKFFILDSSNIFGYIKINSSPTSSVFIDDVALGKVPYESKIKAGEHELKLIPLGDATGAASFSRHITVSKNTLAYVNVDLGSSDVSTAADVLGIAASGGNSTGTGAVAVDTDPPGAIVSLDTEEKGTAPLILSDIPAGTHEVSVSLPTFFPRTQKINVQQGYRVEAFFKLALDKNEVNKQQDRNQKAAEEKNTSSNKKTIVVGDTPTGWLRVRADASVTASEEAKVNPGQEFVVQEEKGGWYRIEYEKGKTGWISGDFVTVKEATTPTPSPSKSPTT